jgi:hypothetical protein
MASRTADEIRAKVSACRQNCWMVGSAKTAMRHPRFIRLPKMGPLLWVLENKARATFGLKINTPLAVAAAAGTDDPAAARRLSHLHETVKRRHHSPAGPAYERFGPFDNQ